MEKRKVGVGRERLIPPPSTKLKLLSSFFFGCAIFSLGDAEALTWEETESFCEQIRLMGDQAVQCLEEGREFCPKFTTPRNALSARVLQKIQNEIQEVVGSAKVEKSMSAILSEGEIMPNPEIWQNRDITQFEKPKLLTAVTLSADITEIPRGMFEGFVNLRRVNLPVNHHLAKVDEGISSDCPKLETVFLKDCDKVDGFNQVERLGRENIRHVVILNGPQTTCTFSGVDDNDYPWERGILSETNIDSVNLPVSLTSLEKNCFYSCKKLKSVELPHSLMSLGECCFQSCSGLRSIELPDSLEKLGMDCFSLCEEIDFLVLPASLKTIEDYTFYDGSVGVLDISKVTCAIPTDYVWYRFETLVCTEVQKGSFSGYVGSRIGEIKTPEEFYGSES